ncbi:biofilm master transcriptional regulator CsgD [Pluralibacter sp.]|uniref:biofilm master transcriptional regulator CsgD n=1 Tax=Pluralibacter sp. TaxID=1920032 RepID=UPI002600199E|nr:biofilm master transcriptional regulator CsgD [Pluralibacter sp.]MBV8044921.1 transcriptional regulator CsgD [Pluralibacter sp.]
MRTDKTPSVLRSLLLITRPSLQSTLLLQALKKRFYNDVTLEHCDVVDSEIIDDGDLLLFDMQSIDSQAMHQWCFALQNCPKQFKVLLFNTPQHYHNRDIVEWPMISGVFHTETDEEHLIDGIKNVCRGEKCFPKVINDYIVQQLNLSHPQWNECVELTRREKEILCKLRQGASNIEIAHLLFISENTVKTHIYNLFKKLSVKNRTQAVFWANRNLR